MSIIASIGGISMYLVNLREFESKLLNLLLFLFSIVLFLFFLWIGTILGLDGTLWN
ncbi:MAG: hypothetical protein IE891_09755 [Flavobacteriaceae bacterium]|nr:hypothetical protein [Flavobacteriaceae bacterium]